MIRLMLPFLVLMPAFGCLSLDGLFLAADTTEAYDLSSDVIPEEAWELVDVTSADGTRLSGLWAHRAGKRPLVFLHGINNHIATDNTKSRLELYWQADTHDVFAIDYRGYGTSDGEPERDGVLEDDGYAAIQYVVDQTGFAPEEIDVVALSMGGAVALHTLDELDVRSVTLEAVFPSANLLGDDGVGLDLPPSWFFEADWDNLDAATETHSPSFVIHGLADDFIDPRYGPMLHAALPDPRHLWQPEGVGHDDIHRVLRETYGEVLGRFHADPYTDPVP